MGRKPKDAKKITLKFDRGLHELLCDFCRPRKIKITQALEEGAAMWLKRRKAQAKQRPKHPTP